jgi:hypothetical protein
MAVPKAASEFLFQLLLCHWSILKCVWHRWFSKLILGSHAAFGITFTVTVGYLEAGTSVLKRFTAWKDFQKY